MACVAKCLKSEYGVIAGEEPAAPPHQVPCAGEPEAADADVPDQ